MQRNNLKQEEESIKCRHKEAEYKKKYREVKIQSKTQEEILKCKKKWLQYQRKYRQMRKNCKTEEDSLKCKQARKSATENTQKLGDKMRVKTIY